VRRETSAGACSHRRLARRSCRRDTAGCSRGGAERSSRAAGLTSHEQPQPCPTIERAFYERGILRCGAGRPRGDAALAERVEKTRFHFAAEPGNAALPRYRQWSEVQARGRR
jgi:hypothetical protein